MLAADRVIEFIAEIAVSPVQQHVDDASRECEGADERLVSFEPGRSNEPLRSDRRYGGGLFLDNSLRFLQAVRAHFSNRPCFSKSAQEKSVETATLTHEKAPVRRFRPRLLRCGSRRGSRRHRRGLDAVQFGESLLEIGPPAGLNQVLARSLSLWSAFSITAVQLFDDFHPTRNHPESGKTHPVQGFVVTDIDEELRGSGVRSRGGKRDEPLMVALRHRVVLNRGLVPDLRNFRIGAQAKLDHEPRKHSEKASPVKEVMADEIIETV